MNKENQIKLAEENTKLVGRHEELMEQLIYAEDKLPILQEMKTIYQQMKDVFNKLAKI